MNIGVFGYGRWSKIYINEIFKRFKSINLYIYSKIKIKNKNKRLFFIRKKNFTNNKKINHFLILNSTENHKQTINLIYKTNYKILVEKPLTNYPLDYFDLNKKNIYLGLQYSFSSYFLYLRDFLKKKNEKIVSLELNWQDSYLDKKIFNKKINFIEDVYYHFYSICRIFIIKKKLENKKIIHINKNKILINFDNYCKGNLHVKINLKKIRLLKIHTKRNFYTINFLDLNEVVICKNDSTIKVFNKDTKNLIKQFNYFLKLSKNIQKNSLVNLQDLFDDLLIINNRFN